MAELCTQAIDYWREDAASTRASALEALRDQASRSVPQARRERASPSIGVELGVDSRGDGVDKMS